jgi:hypothetical protein
LITRETVFFETLASRAMSLIVALRPTMPSVGFATEAGSLGDVPFAETDDLDLGMVFVLSTPQQAKKDPQCTRAKGLDKASAAPLNDTGFPRTTPAVRALALS